MSFFKKILLFMIIPALLPIILTTLAYFAIFEPAIKNNIETSISTLSLSLSDELSNIIIESVKNTELLAKNPVVNNSESSIGAIENEIRKSRDFHDFFKDISLIENNGDIIASVDYSFRGEFRSSRWYEQAVKGEIVVSDIHAVLYPYQVVMTVFCPVGDSGKMLVSQLELEALWASAQRVAERRGGEIWILDDKGIVISSPDKNRILERYPDDSIVELLKKKETVSLPTLREGIEISNFLTPFDRPLDHSSYVPQWNVLYIEETSIIYKTLSDFRIVILVRGIVSLFIISILSFFLSHNLSSRIRKLQIATLQLGQGNYEMTVKDRGNDEISDLIRIFSGTQQKLMTSERKLKDAKERFELAARGANDAIWDWDIKEDKIYCASKWFDIIGTTPLEGNHFTYSDWIEIIHLDDRKRFEDRLQDHFDNALTLFEEEYRILRPDNKIKWIMTKGIALYDNQKNKIRMAGSHSDITERKIMEQKVSFYAYFDSLTELPNRTKLMDTLYQALNRAARKEDYSFCLLYLDFDGFKHVNDTYGHNVGDLLLITISQRLKECIRPLDLVSRTGGDEFVIFLDGIDNNDYIESILERILTAAREEFSIDEHSIFITVSIGIVIESRGVTSADDLIQKADIAMYYSKINGKNKYTFFSEELQIKEVKRWSMENELHKALETGTLQVYYQPIIESREEDIFSFEALLRWNHPVKGMIPPDEFIPSAEETGFISKITEWLIGEICIQAREWNSGTGHKETKISFNATAKDFLIPGGLDRLIERRLRETSCESRWIALEVTERTMIKDFGSVLTQIRRLRQIGIAIELDDFGTGYSSLSYLNKFEIDYLKIDQSFIRSMVNNRSNMKIVRTIINLAHDLNLKIIAEGVETVDEASILKEWGCEYFQGYYYSRPLPREDASYFLSESRSMA